MGIVLAGVGGWVGRGILLLLYRGLRDSGAVRDGYCRVASGGILTVDHIGVQIHLGSCKSRRIMLGPHPGGLMRRQGFYQAQAWLRWFTFCAIEQTVFD